MLKIPLNVLCNQLLQQRTLGFKYFMIFWLFFQGFSMTFMVPQSGLDYTVGSRLTLIALFLNIWLIRWADPVCWWHQWDKLHLLRYSDWLSESIPKLTYLHSHKKLGKLRQAPGEFRGSWSLKRPSLNVVKDLEWVDNRLNVTSLTSNIEGCIRCLFLT